MDDAQLLAEIEDLLRTRPDNLGVLSDDSYAWLGRARALMAAWDHMGGIAFGLHVDTYVGNATGIYGINLNQARESLAKISAQLQGARFALRLKTTGPLAVAVNRGQPFDYFDEVRRIIAAAQSDILFVDPYMNADFVQRYLPHIRSGVTIRLLASKTLPTLLPAVEQFAQQHRVSVEVRKPTGRPHDRYVFVDNGQCYLSSASFQDGGRLSPATLQQITDSFVELSAIYEGEWASATVQRRP